MNTGFDRGNSIAITAKLPLLATWCDQDELFANELIYSRSIYLEDPNGMICEFTHDHAEVETINKIRFDDAHSELKRWLAGDHHSKNMFR